MSIARVTMHEFNEENMHEEVETLYKTIVDEYFPNLERLLTLRQALRQEFQLPFTHLLKARKLIWKDGLK